MENKIKNCMYIEEFELVDNSKQGVYSDKETKGRNNVGIENTGNNKVYNEKNVYIEPVYKSATSIEYNVYYLDEKNELALMGTVRDNKQIVLTVKYKDRKRLEVDGKEFDFDSQKLEADVQKMIEQQRSKENMRKKDYNQKENLLDDNKEEKEKQSDISMEKNEKDKIIDNKKGYNKKENKEDKNDLISDKELIESGYDITHCTKIKGPVLDRMIAENYNPNSVIVVERDNKPVVLAKEVGPEGKIKELPIKPTNNSMEEVNEFDNNVQRTRGTGTRIELTNFPGVVFDINKNNKNQIGVLADIEKDGKYERFNVGEPIHPTDQEFEMQKYVNAGYNFAPANPLLTDKIISDYLEKMPEDVKSEVKNVLDGMVQNPTKDEFDRIVENVLNEKEENERNEKDDDVDKHEHYTERYLGDKYEAHP